MHVVVIGCGLAGLTVAIALAQGGHKVTIVESAPLISYIGAGIQVSPNSSRILRKLGIDKYIEKYATEPIDLRMMSWRDGKMLVECPLKDPAHEEYFSPYWHIHRADLHRGLMEAATELGCNIHLDSRVMSIDPEEPSLITKGDNKYSADLIIASDGLHSMARSIVLGQPAPPVPTGQMVYRVTVPARELKGIPELEEIVSVPRNNHWLGPNGTVLSYLLEGVNEALVNFVFTCDVQMPEGVNQRPGNMEVVRKRFAEWDPRIVKILEHVGTVIEWRLFTHSDIPTWTHPSHKLTLIGDSAHAMTPYLAQGAAMGIEDAAILGTILTSPPFTTSSPFSNLTASPSLQKPFPNDNTSAPSILPSTTQTALPTSHASASASSSPVAHAALVRALQIYEKLRIPRAQKVAHESIGSRWFTQMPDGPEQAERDAYLLANPGIKAGHRNVRSEKGFLDWLFGFDAWEALEEELSGRREDVKVNGDLDRASGVSIQGDVEKVETAVSGGNGIVV